MGLSAEGLTTFPWQCWPNMVSFNALGRWRCGGLVGYGEIQDFFEMPQLTAFNADPATRVAGGGVETMPPLADLFDLDGTFVQTREASWKIFAHQRAFHLGVDTRRTISGCWRTICSSGLRRVCRDEAQAGGGRSSTFWISLRCVNICLRDRARHGWMSCGRYHRTSA